MDVIIGERNAKATQEMDRRPHPFGSILLFFHFIYVCTHEQQHPNHLVAAAPAPVPVPVPAAAAPAIQPCCRAKSNMLRMACRSPGSISGCQKSTNKSTRSCFVRFHTSCCCFCGLGWGVR